MSEQKVMNRWMVVIGAILIQLSLGAIYAWSVFTPFVVSTMPKMNKETGVYTEQVVFGQADGKYVGVVTPLVADDAELLEGREVRTYEVMKATDATGAIVDVPKGYPDFDPKTLKPATVKVIVKSDLAADAKPLAPKASHISADKARWDKTQSQIVFAAGLASFAVIMVIAGRMMPKVGPRKLAVAGGIVLGAGYVLAGMLGAHSFMNTLIFVGFVGGAGIGLAYVVPIAVGMRWFPDKKGLITGLAVAGFGFGATLWVKLAGSWGDLLAIQGINMTFIIYGAVFLVAVVIGGIWMVFPPAGWKPQNYTPPEQAKGGGKPVAGTVDFTPGQMLAKVQYYMILLTFAFGASAGLMSIGLMKLFPTGALKNAGYGADEASAIAGTAMAIFFALANGIGRVAWGALSDKLGRKMSIIVMMATQGIIVICFQWMAGNEYLLYLGATIIGFNFGGNFALFPTITADTFGAKHVGQNYGWVFLAYGIGGIFGPILGGKLGDMGNFPLAFTICGGLCLVAAVLISMVRHPRQKQVMTGAEA